jgi:ribosome maturation protein Sdo1
MSKRLKTQRLKTLRRLQKACLNLVEAHDIAPKKDRLALDLQRLEEALHHCRIAIYHYEDAEPRKESGDG